MNESIRKETELGCERPCVFWKESLANVAESWEKWNTEIADEIRTEIGLGNTL